MGRQRIHQPRLLRLLLTAAPLVGALCLAGCSSVKYVVQAGFGQLAIANRTRPIPEVLRDPRSSARVKRLLSELPAVKRFGEARGLAATHNHTEYVALDRPAAVWVVSACEPAEFRSRSWWFPIAGSFTYLGWFDREDAEEYADRVAKEDGLDVDVRPAPAYSTLGWFRDPVYSPMLREGEDAMGYLVSTILHEGTHDTLYVDGQSVFNESVASFVGEGMAREYFAAEGGRLDPELKAWEESSRNFEKRSLKLHEAHGDLQALYSSKQPREAILAAKAARLARLEKDLGIPEGSRKRPINNATLIQYQTYRTGQEAFARLFAACGKDWKRFLKAFSGLKSEHFPQLQAEDIDAVVDALAKRGC
ncbi:MAG: aminopeptidase [Bdellovibrionales bacterium]|nr:aminopeptidase [Bdellovibrionales bacterium]